MTKKARAGLPRASWVCAAESWSVLSRRAKLRGGWVSIMKKTRAVYLNLRRCKELMKYATTCLGKTECSPPAILFFSGEGGAFARHCVL